MAILIPQDYQQPNDDKGKRKKLTPQDLASGTYFGQMQLRGSILVIKDNSTTASGYIAFGTSMTTIPTSPTAGTGVYQDYRGIYGLNANTQQFYLQASNGKAYAGAGAVTLDVNGITIFVTGSPTAYFTFKNATDGDIGYLISTGSATDQLVLLRTANQDADSLANLRSNRITGGTTYATDFLLRSLKTSNRNYATLFGTGATLVGLNIGADSVPVAMLQVTGTTYFGGNIVSDLLFTDATYDIGASGATRPRNLYLSGNAVVGGTITGTTTGNAPVGSAFVTIGTDATLTSERALTGTSNQITVTDNGAGSTVVLSTPQNIHTAATPTFAGMTINGSSGAVFTVDTNVLYVDATNNRIGINRTPGKTLDISGTEQPLIRMTYTNSSSSSVGPAIDFYVNDGAAMASGDRIGAFQFGGAVDAANTLYASVFALSKTTEAWSGTAGGGKFELYTTPNTTQTPTLALTIGQDQSVTATGNLGVGNATFGASATAEIAMKNGTAPSGNVTDVFQLYSADQAAGNAAPHFRTENGDVIKIYKGATFTQTYATANATLNADGVTDPAAYGAGANGYSTGAMASAVHAAVIALHADLLDVKQFINSLVDELQAKGEIG